MNSATFAQEEVRKFEALLATAASQVQDGFLNQMARHPLDECASGELGPPRASIGRTGLADMPVRLPLVTPTSGLLLCIRDLKGKFVKLSHSWETSLGFPIEALQGTPLLTLVHPADVWLTHDRMEAVRGDRAEGGFSNRYCRHDGDYRQLEWAARLFGDQIFGIARDVTEPAAIAGG